MFTIPQPPSMPELLVKGRTSGPHSSIHKNIVGDSNLCTWAYSYPELKEACVRSCICVHNAPYTFRYRQLQPLLQVGPTCGLVALCMMLTEKSTVDEILHIAKLEGYSINGEIFSGKDMLNLTQKLLRLHNLNNANVELCTGGLAIPSVIEKLLNNSLLLIPYDADFNHSPCMKRGHKAHWALVCGILIPHQAVGDRYSANDIYVLCRHGKSSHLAVWSLDQLERSNNNLFEFSPKRDDDGLEYILPEGGVGGENGLCGQYVLIEGL